MNTYHVEIREVTTITIAVQANSLDQALEEAYSMGSYEIGDKNVITPPDSHFDVISVVEA